mgnify:CR=1 FL=1
MHIIESAETYIKSENVEVHKKSESFMTKINKSFRKSASKIDDEEHDLSDDAEGHYKKENTIGDKDRYPTADDHIFWTELGIDPINMEDLKLKPKHKYTYLFNVEVFCHLNEKFLFFMGFTKEDKQANIKKNKYIIEIMNLKGENLYTSDINENHLELTFKQWGENIQIYI